MNIDIKLLESDKEITQNILQLLSIEVQKILNKSIDGIKNKIKSLIKNTIINQPEYTSLKSGKLRLDFGIPDTNVVDNIVNNIVDSLSVTIKNIKINRNNLDGGIIIEFLNEANIQAILSSDDGMVKDTKGYSLPWLSWLLTEGVNPIVKQYNVRIGPSKNSRTGMAIMIRSPNDWSVPPQFAGSSTNNWITRSFNDIQDNQLSSIIKEEINKLL